MHTVRRTPAGTARRKKTDSKKGFAFCFQAGNVIQRFRRKASEKPAPEPVEETPSELRKRLTQELEVMNQEDDKEKEEEQQQKIHERSNTKPHWKQARKKPGPKNKEEDEALMERFPEGQVSCALKQ